MCPRTGSPWPSVERAALRLPSCHDIPVPPHSCGTSGDAAGPLPGGDSSLWGWGAGLRRGARAAEAAGAAVGAAPGPLRRPLGPAGGAGRVALALGRWGRLAAAGAGRSVARRSSSRPAGVARAPG